MYEKIVLKIEGLFLALQFSDKLKREVEVTVPLCRITTLMASSYQFYKISDACYTQQKQRF